MGRYKTLPVENEKKSNITLEVQTDKLDKLIKAFESEEREEEKRRFKIPLRLRLQKMLFTRKKYLLIMLIRSNESVLFKKVAPEDNTYKVGDTIYDASADYVLRYKRYPLIIQPEWTMKPFSTKDNFKEAVEEGTLTSTEKVIIARIEKDMVKQGFSASWGTILI